MEVDESQAAEYVYDLGSRLGLVMRELFPEMHTAGPQKCYRERATDDATGYTIWAAATLLGRWILAHPEAVAGKDVIELGAGCGVTGLAAACGASPRTMVLSDYPTATMSNLLYSTARNCARVREGSAVSTAAAVGGKGAAPAPVTATVAGAEYHLNDVFVSPAGCEVTLAQLDWDEPATWPRTGGGGDGGGGDSDGAFATYDVIICADLFYRRSYSRKVAAAVRAMLRPGGLVLAATPTAREGLQTLDGMMAAAGFASVEEPFPAAWRVNPLRRPGPVEGSGGGGLFDGLQLERLGLAPAAPGASEWRTQLDALLTTPRDGEGGGDVEGELVVPLELVAAATAEAGGAPPPPPPPLHFVGDERARGMFPEMAVPSYSIVVIQFTRNNPAGDDENEGEGGE
jgi:predicted nicotinamide N-methyase